MGCFLKLSPVPLRNGANRETMASGGSHASFPAAPLTGGARVPELQASHREARSSGNDTNTPRECGRKQVDQ
ncbi:hypothetical protein GCM10023160_12650 [Brachybacterium paraconglomeratum]